MALLVHPTTNACLIGEARFIKPVLRSIAAPVDKMGSQCNYSQCARSRMRAGSAKAPLLSMMGS